MNAIRPSDSLLVLIDYQQRLLPVIDRADEALATAVRIADIARLLGVPVLGTEQNPEGLGPTVPALRERLATTLSKTHFDACEDGLLDLVRDAMPAFGNDQHRDLVIAGCESHICLLQTALGLMRAGHRVWVVAQACGARRPDDHLLAMQRLRSAGAIIVSHDMVAFEWLQHCRHRQFKAVLPLLKDPPGAGGPVRAGAGPSPRAAGSGRVPDRS